MSNIDSNILCPACQGALTPTVLSCGHCNIRVDGPFRLNEFATLAPDDLHFLRIFIRCEGRIRDMEPALGLSYPTIRNRLTQLKNKLMADEPVVGSTVAEKLDTRDEILDQLDRGKISFEQAMSLIKKGSKS